MSEFELALRGEIDALRLQLREARERASNIHRMPAALAKLTVASELVDGVEDRSLGYPPEVMKEIIAARVALHQAIYQMRRLSGEGDVENG
jgi:hypothetical protein